MVQQKFFEDFKTGETFQIPSKTMHDGHFIFFAGLTGDAHPIHYDDEYCKKHLMPFRNQKRIIYIIIGYL